MTIKDRVKVAVASADGKMVNLHFGKATQFLIFQVGQKGIEFVEKRENPFLCGCVTEAEECGQSGIPQDPMDQAVLSLKDCAAVLCSRIGPECQERLLA